MRILVVDDSKVMRSIVVRALKAAGYDDVVEATGGRQALEMLHAEDYDFVLSDWNMPEVDGMGVVTTLESEGRDVPVAFITSECTDAMLMRALEAGVRFVLTKPFTPDALRDALERALADKAA